MDDTPHQGIDPTRLFSRATVVVLALAGAVLVLLPSTQFGWSEIKGGWAIRPVLYVADLTAYMAIVLALAIAWSRQAHRAAPLLGAALGAGAVAWGLQSADAVRGLDGRNATLIVAASSAAWLLGAALLSAFCTRFPRLLTRADIAAMQRRTIEGHVGSGLSAREDPFTVMDAPFLAWDRWVERRFGSGYQQRLQAFARRVGLVRAAGEQGPWMRRLNDWVERWLLLDAWRIVLVLVPLVLACALLRWREAATMAVGVGCAIGVMSCLAQRFMLLDATVEQRRQTLWIAAGMVGAFVVVQLLFWSFLLSFPLGSPQLGLGLFVLSAPLGALVLVIGFAIATFGSGALDPGLAIKRTLITGIVATLVTFVFALVEGLVANLLAEQAGLPTAMAPAIAGAAVAVALGPMWHKVSAWVGGKLNAALPVEPRDA
jgi:hypothetical protein